MFLGRVFTGLLFLTGSMSISAQTLGQTYSPLKTDLLVIQHRSFTVHERRSPSQGILRYATLPNRKVFALAWKTPVLIPLKHHMGIYFPRIQSEQQKPQAMSHRASLQIEQPDFFLTSRGRLRAFQGYTYLPLQKPQTFQLQHLHTLGEP